MQGRAAVDGLAGNGDALVERLLSVLQHLDAKGGVGQDDIFLGGQGMVLQYGVKDFLGFQLGGSGNEFFGTGWCETEVGG